MENLEPRRLFTTLVGGDVFEYSAQDPANPANFITNRIVLQGNIVAELIGGSIDPNSSPLNPTVLISDVPGTFFQSQIGRAGTNFLGGVGGGSGVQIITTAPPGLPNGTNVTAAATFPGANPQGFIPYTGGSAQFNQRATVVVPDNSPQGATTYGFNVVRIGGEVGTADELAIVQVLRFDPDGRNARVVAELNAAIPVAPNSTFLNVNGIEAINAAAYDPVTNRIFFVARGNNQGNITPAGGATAPTLVPTQKLFSVALTNATGAELTSTQIAASLQAFPGTFNRTAASDTKVNALAVDRIGGTSRIVGFYVDTVGGGIFEVNLANTNFLENFARVRSGAVILNSVTGLAFVNESPDSRDNLVFAVEAGSAGTALGTAEPTLASDAIGPQVLLINRTNGVTQQLGSLPGRVGTTINDGVGNDLQSLAFDPFRRNPYTGERGTLVSMDVETDQFVAVDARNRLPGVSAFSLFVSRAEPGSSIVVGQVEPFNPEEPNEPRPMQPFSGSAGTLRVTSANGQGLINLTSPSGVGGVFLGLKTSGNEEDDLNNIPVIAGHLATSLGVRGAGAVRSGIVTSPSLLRALTNQGTLADRLLGQNVTDVAGVVVLPAGATYVIDSDGLDSAGRETVADQLTLVDRNTGRAISQQNIFRTVAGNQVAMSNSRGVTIDEQERILAIFLQRFADVGGGAVAGTLPGRYPDFGTLGQTPQALTISGPGPTGFILVDTAVQRFLYSFSNVGGQLEFVSLGPIVDADGNTVAAARSLGVSGTQLLTVGFPVGNPVPVQNTGGGTANLAGVDPRSLAYANDGNLYLLSVSGQGLEVRMVQRDLVSGALTGLGAPSVLALDGTSPVQAVNDLTPDPTSPTGSTLLGVGSTALSLLPTRSLGDLTQAPDGFGNFQYRGVTRIGADQLFAVTFNGSTLNLRRAQLAGTPLQTVPNSFNIVPATPRPGQRPGNDIRIDANPASGTGPTTAVLGIQATTRRPGDNTGIYGVGFSADALIPSTSVLGDLGAANVQQIAMSLFSVSSSIPDVSYVLPTLGGIQYGFTRYFTAFRDTATSGLLNAGNASYTVQVVGQNFDGTPGLPIAFGAGTPGVEALTRSFGTVANGILDTRAMTIGRVGGSVYLTSGFNYDSPVPAAPIPGNLGGFFGVDPFSGESNLRGFAFGDPVPTGQLQDAFAVLFNGTGNDIYRMTRSSVTGGITGFTKVSTPAIGIRDPRNDRPILFVYTLFKDPNIANRFFLIGSSDPTAESAPMTLYALDIVTDPAGTTVTVNNSDQPPRDLTQGGFPLAGDVFKAGAINSAGEMFVVLDTSGAAPSTYIPDLPSSLLLRVDRTTGAATSFGFVATKTFSSGPGGEWSSDNSNPRGMQFRVDTDGIEKLVILDQAHTGGGRIAELDLTVLNDKLAGDPPVSTPQVAPGGVLANISGVPVVVPAAVPFQSSLPGMVDASLTTFAIDQYGRGFSIRPGTSPANPDQVWVSPNELFAQEFADSDPDDDNWLSENIRIGWLVNPDGSAFLDSFTTFTGDLTGGRLIGVARNDLASSLRTQHPLFGIDRLYSLAVPGSVALPTEAPNSQDLGARIVVTPVRRAGQPLDTGRITINGVGTTPGEVSNIRGLGFDIDGSLIALDRTATGGRIVALTIDPTDSLTDPLTGNPTFNTFTVTDELATPFTGLAGAADPRGLATDLFGRIYTADGSTIPTGRTQLLVSSNVVSLFRIDTATGIASRLFDLADSAQLQQQPVLSRFGGIAFRDADTLFLVQKDLRAGGLLLGPDGRPLGVDRLTTATLPATTGGVLPFVRFNSGNTAGAIRVGNTVPPPGTAVGTPTDITAMDFTATGQLVALDTGVLGSNRLVRIEIDPANVLSPTNSVYISDPGAAFGLTGLSAFGTQLAAVNTAFAVDLLLVSANDLSLFAVNPATGVTTIRGGITINGTLLTDDQPVVALATQPGPGGAGTGLIHAILRGSEPGTGTPADFLYTINAATGAAALVGQVRLSTDHNGNAITPARNTRITQLEFSGERDAAGNHILLGLHDPETTVSDRQLIRIGLTPGTVSTSAVVRGSDPGDVPDTLLGLAGDVLDGNQFRLPLAHRGRMYGFDLAVPTAATLNATPTQLLAYTGQLTLPTGTNAAFGVIGNLLAPPGTLTPQGGVVLDTIRTMDVAPASGQLFAVRESFAGVSTLVGFPNPLPAVVTPGTRPAAVPTLILAGGSSIGVASASSVALPGQPVPTFTGAPAAAQVQSVFFLPDGTLRGVARLTGEPGNRLIDIPTEMPALSVARTNPGVPDAAYGAFTEFNNLVFAIDFTDPNNPRITVPNDAGGAFPPPGGVTAPGVGPVPGGVLGSPTLGVINPATGEFTPANTGDPNAPGRLPASITDVQAFAYHRATRRLFLIDQNSTLLEISAASGAILRTIGVVRDNASGQTLRVSSMTFDPQGRLIAHDPLNARAIDISPVTALAGAVVATAPGTLPATVTALAFDALGNRLVAADNATGINLSVNRPGFTNLPTAQLFQIPLTLAAAPQDLGRVFIGGTVAGQVSFSGSVDEFYAGWIITGTTSGLPSITAPNPLPGNFSVAGDLRSLTTIAPIGTADVADDIFETTYRSGTDIRVGGRIGVVQTLGDMAASVRAFNERVPTVLGNTIFERERRALAGEGDSDGFLFQGTLPGGPFGTGTLGRISGPSLLLPAINNDTQETAQRLSALSNPDGTSSGAVRVLGQLENIDGVNDTLDFYRVALFAGQSIDLQLMTTDVPLYFGIFDPDGRLVFSSHSLTVAADPRLPFRFTADRPGDHRIAIARPSDTNFNGQVGDPLEDNLPLTGMQFYTLTISGLGDLGIGAVVAGGTLLHNAPFFAGVNIFDFSTIYAARGDIGSVNAAVILGTQSVSANTVRSAAGGIRSITVGAAGEERDGFLVRGMSFAAAGNIGLVQSTAGLLLINTELPAPLGSRGTLANFNPDLYRVRGDIQIISASTTLSGTMLADGGIGVIRAGDMSADIPSFINVNADNRGNDGVIDLIDIAGQMGTLQGGGPIIYTNSGGNVRYMRAGGPVFRDRAFGGGTQSDIFLTAGTPLSFIDDSGATISVRFDERALVRNPGFNPNIPGSPRFLDAPVIAYRPYPVRSGGSVLMALQIDGLGTATTIRTQDPMLTISASAGSGRGAEISLLNLGGTDNPVTVTPDGVFSQAAPAGAVPAPSYRVLFEGARLDIGTLNILADGLGALGNISGITNRTGGELLDLRAASIGTLSWAGDVGVPRPSATGTAIVPVFTGGAGAVANLYPWLQQQYLIAPGDVIEFRSSGAIGNILAGNAGEITANAGAADIPDRFEGIVAPVVATGRVNLVRIGEGILPAGLGAVGAGVLIVQGRLEQVTGSGDIRGMVVSNQSIGTISIGGNGSLINAVVGVLAAAGENPFFPYAPINNSTSINLVWIDTLTGINPGSDNPTFELERLSSAGGIIGTSIYVHDINSVHAGGFGMIDTILQSAGGGTFRSISASGYGLRSVQISPGFSVGSISARGDGSQLPASSVSPSVRRSEFETIDSFFGFHVGTRTDIHVNLTTSAAIPVIRGITDTGVIEDVVANGIGSLGSVSAWSIRGSVPIRGAFNEAFSDFSFGNAIGSITTRGLINGLVVRTGRINSFSPGSDVLSTDITVAGPIHNFRLNGDFASDSVLASIGPNARIGNLNVRGNFEGSLRSDGRVGTITIGGNLTDGTIDINRNGGRGPALSRLNLSGSLLGSSLILNGDVGTINIAGTTGTAGDTLTVSGNLTALNAGTNRKIADKQLAMNVAVAGTLGSVSVNGRITGALTAAGSIRSLRVVADGPTGGEPLIAGDITSTEGDIGTVTVVGGDIAGNLSAFGKIRSLQVTGGSILSTARVTTTEGDIGSVTIRGGSLLGSLRSGDPAASGLRPIGAIIADAIGDGSDPVSILASRLQSLRTTGDVFSQALIDIAGPLNTLVIGGSLQQNAVIRAQSIGRQTIRGEILGDIIIT